MAGVPGSELSNDEAEEEVNEVVRPGEGGKEDSAIDRLCAYLDGTDHVRTSGHNLYLASVDG